jgi:hypothetical protein
MPVNDTFLALKIHDSHYQNEYAGHRWNEKIKLK